MKNLNHIRKITLAFLLLIIGIPALAQSPDLFNYQAVVRDANGQVMQSQSVSFQLSVLLGSSTGSNIYTETHTLTTNQFGMANLQVGNGVPVSGTFGAIDWGMGTYFLQVELDETGGSNYSLMGTSQLVSVPYALHAKTVEIDQVDDADADPNNELQTIAATGSTVTLSNGGGSFSIDDADADPNNELQDLSLTGTTLSLSNSNATVDLSSLQDTLWQANGNDIYNANSGNVGIGTNAPSSWLDIAPTVGTTGNTVLRAATPADNNYATTDVAVIQSGPSGSGVGGTVLTVQSRHSGDSALTLLDVRNNAAATAQSQFIVTSDGRAGIDTEDPMAHFAVGHNYNIASSSLADSMNIDLHIGGTVNSTYTRDAVKLHIARYDNDGSLVYPILVEDENSNTDFYLRNRPSSSGSPFAYFGGNVSINTDTTYGRFAVNGNIRMLDGNNDQKFRTHIGSGVGRWTTYGSTGAAATTATSTSTTTIGYLGTYSDGDIKTGITTGSSDNAGQIFTYGPNGSFNTALFRNSSDNNCGYIYAMDSSSNDRAALIVGSVQTGIMNLRANTGNYTIRGTYLTNYEDHGYLAVYDNSGAEAGVYVNASGQGVVWGDVKNFRMDHPTQQGKEIWYASLEGPEAAAYVRGTGQIVNGEGIVEFPEHFELVANPTTMTVTLTPLSGQSKGLAVIEKTAQGFKVVELMGGNGNYEFDWEAKAVRQGYENYRVIRDASEMEAGDADQGPMQPNFAVPAIEEK